jgi:type VI secretion system protein VasG
MVNIGMDKIVEKLSPLLKLSLEESAQSAISEGNYNVELEHWLSAILEKPHTDLISLLRLNAEFNIEVFISELKACTQNFQSGNSRPPSFSKNLLDLASEAWILASVKYSHRELTSGHLLMALLENDDLAYTFTRNCNQFNRIKKHIVEEKLPSVIGSTSESALINEKDSPSSTQVSQGTALKKFTVDLTERARNNEIDPVLGRDAEVRQLIDILLRRRQNNPILTGEPGVGKTAVVEGFANRIVTNDVPDALKGIRLLSLDMGLLQAGASVKGEFEKRLKSVIQEVKESEEPTIVFIDEAHTLIGAGGAEGKGDAANLLKPALARGEFRTIAATTWSEYKKYFEKDPALTRRFQVVNVAEPSVPVAIDMMRGIARSLESHHKIRILDEAIEASVKLSSRYIPSRQLPDKSVSLLDTACARVALSQGATPAPIERAQRIIEQCDTNISLLKEEQIVVGGCEDKIAENLDLQETQQAVLAELNVQWEAEKTLIESIKEKRDQGKSLSEYQADLDKLSNTQGDNPMVHLDVTAQSVAEIVENWTGIPVGNMVSDEIEGLLNLEQRLQKRVVGQDHAMQKIAQAIRISRSGLTDPRKPVGVFMMVGTSGTGKTETALALADYLYGGEKNLITINMSEFKEEHKVSMLLGASAGYVGYGEGGVLTEAVRKNPYSVVLLDEMEKAHPGIQDVFYNLFDKGTIKDGEGQDIDFKNTLIIMTTNAATHSMSQYFGKTDVDENELLEAIRPELLEDFRPAFLGRSTIVPYFPLSQEVLSKIIAINLNKIEKRLMDHYKAKMIYGDEVMSYLLEKCTDPDTGARNAENVINKSLLPVISNACLTALAKGDEITEISVELNDGSFIAKVK